MKKNIIFLLLLFSVICSYSQITMTDGGSSLINTATTFYDPGGTSNYANNLYVTHTFNPTVAGRYLKITFSAFNTENANDILYVYNGSTLCSNTLIGAYSGTTIPAAITSSASNGSLTFVFVSDGATRRAGFTASLSQQTTIGTIAYTACTTPPTNDNPCSAISISGINAICTNVTGTVTNATPTLGITSPSCGSTVGPFTDVWYSFTATSTTTNIQTEALTGSADLSMQVYTNNSSCSGTWTSISCDNDNHPTNAMPYLSSNGSVSNPLTTVIGQVYYIRIFPFTSGSAATFNLCVFNNVPPSCSNNTAPTTGSVLTTVNPTLSWNAVTGATLYDIYLGTTNPPTSLLTSNLTTTNFTLTTALTASTTYYWYVVPKNGAGSAVGCNSTTTNFISPSPPSNDNCNQAIMLTLNPTSTITTVNTFNTNFATQSQAACAGTADDDVWFYFDATSSRHNFKVTSSTNVDMMHEVFSGTCSGGLTNIICSDPDVSSSDCFTPGQRYYVRVYSYYSNSASGTVTLGVGTSTIAAVDATCITATQICAPFNFTAGVNQPSGGAGCGANYGCLGTTPNPEYHWLQITNSGTLNYTVSSTAGDVDFALWRISGTPMPASTCGGTQTINCGTTLGAPIACSYSSSATEIINVAVTPGYYLLLATNFANVPGIVSLTANTGNTASVGCPCVIAELTAIPTSCNTTNNSYTLNGTLSYNSIAPTSGTLTITDNNGNSLVYNYPFPTSPISYSITGNTSDGIVHTVQAIFSANTSCNRCVSYTAPASCCLMPTANISNIIDNGCGFTFDLIASGAGGGPYEWSTDFNFTTILTSTTNIVFPLGKLNQTYYLRALGYNCSTSILVTDTTPALDLTIGHCMTCSIGDGETRTFYDASNNIILSITDPVGGTSLGITTACAYVDASDINYNGQDYMRRHFDLDVTNNGPATVSIYISAQDVSNIVNASTDDILNGYGVFNTISDLCVTAYHGAGETPLSNITKTLIPHGSLSISGPYAPNNYYIVSFPVSDFSGFYCHACNPNNNPLPVEYISFDGYHSANDNVLVWVTATEINNEYFQLERSIDGNNWQSIAKLDGAGYSSTNRTYNYYDIDVYNTDYYYRLKQVDFDGVFKYSKVVFLSSNQISVNNIYPNPAQNMINYSIASDENKDVNVRVIDVTGNVIINEIIVLNKGANSLKLNINNLASGVYTLQVTDQTGNTKISNTFIKE